MSFYGDKNLFVKTVNSKPLGKVKLGDFQGDLYQGQIESDIDIGNQKPLLLPFLMAVIANIMNKKSKRANVSYRNFIPQYADGFSLNPFQKIILEGYIIIVSLDSKTKVVLYANAASFTDKNNQKYDHFQTIKNELLEQIKNITIEKVD